jgi:hypothetical protein
MKSVGRKVIALGAALSAISMQFVVIAGPASATATCDPPLADNETKDTWAPSNETPYGIRAPITITTDATVCAGPSGWEPGFNSVWVGINSKDQSPARIAQIGFIGQYDASLGGVEYCRFWATGGGGVKPYGQCQVTNDYSRNFKVKVVEEGTQNTPAYELEDCPPGAWDQTCQVEDASEVQYQDALAYAVSEVDYHGCQIWELGSSSDHVNFGSSTYNIQGEPSYNGSWSTPSLNTSTPQSCTTKYESNFNSGYFGTWDYRN